MRRLLIVLSVAAFAAVACTPVGSQPQELREVYLPPLVDDEYVGVETVPIAFPTLDSAVYPAGATLQTGWASRTRADDGNEICIGVAVLDGLDASVIPDSVNCATAVAGSFTKLLTNPVPLRPGEVEYRFYCTSNGIPGGCASDGSPTRIRW